MKPKLDPLINLLCRICGEENKNCIPIFGESGKIHNILKKIRACLSFLIIEKTDMYPKQVCLACLSKLDASWDLYSSCQEGQKRIESKLQRTVGLQLDSKGVNMNTIEERIKSLTETESISFGESAIISLAPPSPPPPPFTVAPAVVPAAPVQSAMPQVGGEGIQPQPDMPFPTAIDSATPVGPVSSAGGVRVPGVARKRTGGPVPMPKMLPSSRSTGGSLLNRRRKNGRLRLCKYCRKSFPDDIIDHHVDLHLRRSFFTCLDCNKNFRSEEAMGRHRCGEDTKDAAATDAPIDLEADDQPICL